LMGDFRMMFEVFQGKVKIWWSLIHCHYYFFLFHTIQSILLKHNHIYKLFMKILSYYHTCCFLD
jgi:hypothetical protein